MNPADVVQEVMHVKDDTVGYGLSVLLTDVVVDLSGVTISIGSIDSLLVGANSLLHNVPSLPVATMAVTPSAIVFIDFTMTDLEGDISTVDLIVRSDEIWGN